MVTNAIARNTSAALPVPTYIGQTTAVEQARAVAEVAAAVQVAQQNPRDMNRAWQEMRTSCGRLALASRAFYAVPNRGTGPSVHLARELARIWGNLDYGVHELHRDDLREMSEIRAFAWDQQTNVRSSRTFQVPHRRMGGGAKITDLTEVYLNNQNIGARAVREAIFTVLPADFVGEAQDICRATIEKGEGKPLSERIADMVAAFAGIGVKVPRIEARLDGRKRGQWTAADVADLGVVFSSIKRRDVSVDDEFPPERLTTDEIVRANAARPVSSPPAAGNGRVTPASQKKLISDLARRIPVEGDALPAYLSDLIERDVASVDELTGPELATAVTRMRAYVEQQEPPADGQNGEGK